MPPNPSTDDARRGSAPATGFIADVDARERIVRPEGALELAIPTGRLTTYDELSVATGWRRHDLELRAALCNISRAGIRDGSGAPSAVVCTTNKYGQPVRPDDAFFRTIEEARNIQRWRCVRVQAPPR